MKKLVVFFLCILLIASSVLSFSCVEVTDNPEVFSFKQRMNTLALENDLNRGVSTEAIKLKIKYFSDCK